MRIIQILTIGSLAFYTFGCATPVTKTQWDTCTKICEPHGGLTEACDEFFKGQGCHCADDKIIWLKDKKQ